MGRLGHILLTRCDARTSNGLPGLFLTLSDVALGAGAPPVQLHLVGPTRTDGLLRAISTVVGQARHCRVTAQAVEPSAASGEDAPVVYSDAVVTIYAVPLTPSRQTADHEEQPGSKRARVGSDSGDEAEQPAVRTPAPEPGTHHSVCYLFVLADVPGKFDNDRAEALGVPRGAVRGQLCRGQAIVLESGVTITPEQVCSPPTPGPAVLIVDCPSEAHVGDAMGHLVSCPTLGRVKDRLSVAIHLSPHDVAASPGYAALMAALSGPQTKHIMGTGANGVAPRATVFRSSSMVAARLSVVHPDVFPPLVLDGDAAAQEQQQAAGAGDGPIAGGNLVRWRLRPLSTAGLDATSVPPPLSTAALTAGFAADWPSFVSAALKASAAAWQQHLTSPADPVPAAVAALAGKRGTSPELIFLGTGAAIPSKYRNVSGILLRMQNPQDGCLLLDCGEGTLGQMQRRLGVDAAAAALRGLACVWISHIHADHHMGVLSILAARRAMLGGRDAPPLCIVGPQPLRRVLEAHNTLVEPLSFVFVDLADTTAPKLLPGSGVMPHPAYTAALSKLGLASLTAVPVVHCAHAYAAVLQLTNGLKLVYSGDTRPCEALIAAARDASLLIHEATFEDALLDEAVSKKHSLTKEAVAAGAAAGAYRTLLTHFSQRYPKIPVIDHTFADHTGIAFDMMRLNLADLPALPALLPALRAVFPEHGDGGDDEAVVSAEDLV
jgi:ribonuclease Z